MGLDGPDLWSSDGDPRQKNQTILRVSSGGASAAVKTYNADNISETKKWFRNSELDELPETFWANVTELLIRPSWEYNVQDHEALDLVFRQCTKLKNFIVINPIPTILHKFKALLDSNRETLTEMFIGECGDGNGITEFDFSWISNCSALTSLYVATNSNSVKNLAQIPTGIKWFLSTHYASDEDVVWISGNLNSLETLTLWVEFDGNSNRITESVLKNFLDAPKFRLLILLLTAPDPAILRDNFRPLKEFCDSFGEGVEAELDTDKDFKIVAPSKKADFVFTCSIDRKKFTGI